MFCYDKCKHRMKQLSITFSHPSCTYLLNCYWEWLYFYTYDYVSTQQYLFRVMNIFCIRQSSVAFFVHYAYYKILNFYGNEIWWFTKFTLCMGYIQTQNENSLLLRATVHLCLNCHWEWLFEIVCAHTKCLIRIVNNYF